MAKFNNCCLIPNLMPWILNISLYAATVQDKDAVIVIELDIEAENAKSQP